MLLRKEKMTAMLSTADFKSVDERPANPASGGVNCKLFGDRVAERICLLLKKEIEAWWRGDVPCRGCSRR